MSRVAAVRRHARLLIVLAVAATLAVPIIVGGRDALTHALSLPVRTYLVLFCVIAASWCARALKLHLLLAQLSLRPRFTHTLAASLAIDFAFISTPAGVGGYAACIYYLRRSGASIGAATTLAAADQILDLTFFALVLPLAGILLLWSELPHALAMLAFSTGAMMISGGIVVLLARRRIGAWLLGENALVRRWPALRRRQHIVREFLAGVDANTRLLLAGGPRSIAAIALLTTVQWLTRYGVLWVALALLGHRLSFALTLLLQSLILHAAMWTGVPAGGGGAELGLSAALSPWVPAADIATALLLWRLATFDACLLVGGIAIVAMTRLRHPAQAHVVELADAAPTGKARG
jgi:uncharacterized protein (TIRG00374 family)